MTTVLDYTRKLLYEHDCVVLPELGGFLAYFSHAFYSEQNNLFHPPQKRVAFNEALKLDDGLLVHYMTINEQLTREEAQKRVRNFVEDIKVTIKEKGNYSLEGIGVLETNAEGKLQFEPTLTTNFYTEGFGLKSLQVASIANRVEIANAIAPEDWTVDDRPAEALPLEVPRRRRSRVALYVGGILLAGSALVGGFTQFPSANLQSSLNPFELATSIKTWFSPVIKSNTVHNSETVSANSVVNEEVKHSVSSIATPVPIVEPKAIVKKEKGEVNTVKPSLNVTPLSLKSDEQTDYLVIAGGFSKLENAQKLQNKLQRNGYENAMILNPSPTDGKLIIVAAIGCENNRKAKAQIANVSRLAEANAYIVHQ